jgi:hypothetical protein
VSAHLEIVADAEDARDRIAADDQVAMVLLHDLSEEERDALIRHCAARDIPACHTVDVPRPARRPKGPWQIVFRKKTDDKVPAHRLAAATLTDPVSEDDETGDRVGELIAVLALGVMEHHWRQQPGFQGLGERHTAPESED